MNKTIILLIAFLANSLLIFGQEVSIGTRDMIYSKILNQDRPLSIYFPPSYYTNEKQQYPVLYILDGDYNFHYVTGLIELQSNISENIPEMIVVGISGKDTPTYRKNCKHNVEGIEDAGNADKMIQFVEKELIPYINKKYKSNDYKILAGHSMGGVFIVNTALRKPQLFNHYIAISPALWWGNNTMDIIAKYILNENIAFKTDVYMSLANEKGMGVNSFLGVATSSVLAKKLVKYGVGVLGLLLSIFLFFKLKKNGSAITKKIVYPLLILLTGVGMSFYLLFQYYPSDSNFKFKQFPNENHNSVGAPTYQWALQDIFKNWRVEKTYFDNTHELTTYYQKVKNKYGQIFNTPNGTFSNTVLYILKGNTAELNEMQQEIKELSPSSICYFNTLLATNYIEKKDFDKAEELLTKTLEIYPNAFEVYQKLAEIKKEQGETVIADSLRTISIDLAIEQKVRQWQINELVKK